MMQNNKQKVWLITGISSGIGAALAEFVISNGDIVMGTMRDENKIEVFNLKHNPQGSCAFQADVTDQIATSKLIENIDKEFGRIDVLVNNAGYGLLGAMEEINEQEAREQMETNFFAVFLLTQKVLPIMRRQKSGHIIQITSVAGFQATTGMSMYNASKYAVEGLTQGLALDLEGMGIKVTLIEPGPFRTEFGSTSHKRADKIIDAYENTAHQLVQRIKTNSGTQEGDPNKAAQVIFEVVQSDTPPLHLPLGDFAIDRYQQKMKSIQFDIDNWQSLSRTTSYDS